MNVETRIEKLEALTSRPDEILVIWREPDGDVLTAVTDAKPQHGARAICAEWFGDFPSPKPSWYRNMRGEMAQDEYEAILSDTE